MYKIRYLCKLIGSSLLLVMNRLDLISQGLPSVTSDIDSAVGVLQKKWFIAIVHHNFEKKLSRQLNEQGIENYIATQRRLRIYPSGKKKWTDALLIHAKIFIKCSEKERLEIVKHPYIYRFMTNPSAKTVNGHKSLAMISDKEIDTLRFMLGQSEFPVEISSDYFKKKDAVKVIRGSLKGLEGEVEETNTSNKDLLVRFSLLGTAKVSIPASDLEKI